MNQKILLYSFLLITLLFPNSTVFAETSFHSEEIKSENWAGYTASKYGSTYNAIGGSWIMPTSNGPASSGEATWIGLGGLGRQDLIQIGTITLINTQGLAEYYAWYELLPANPVTITLEVHPGDSITASIVPISTGIDQWLMFIKNNTTGKSYQNVVTYNSSRLSAEWIEEVPTAISNGSYLSLSNFGIANFTNAWAVQDGVLKTISQIGALPTYMINYDTGFAAAVPSPLIGNTFKVTKTSANIPLRNSSTNSAVLI